SACDPVAEEVVRIIQILLHIPPEAPVKRPPIHAEQVKPRICPVQVAIPRHHGAECAERKPIATKACRNEFLVGVLANEGQPLPPLDALPHPRMLPGPQGYEAVEPLLEPLEDMVGVILLPRLHVF